MPRRRLSTRHIYAVGLGVFVVLLGIGHIFDSLRFMGSPIIGLVWGILFALQSRPMIWREGDRIILQNPARKIEKTKPIDSKIKTIIEWDGYEGMLYDIVWTDGDIWTLYEGWGVSLEKITRTLQQLGFGEVPTEKDWRIFRPETPANEYRTDSSSKPLRAVTDDADSASRASSAPALRGS